MTFFNPATQDPAELDKQYPPTGDWVEIDSHGDRMLGLMQSAQGAGPHPTVVFVHGFPGTERNYDLAHACVRAGMNSLVFTHRGTWGSGGSYSFSNIIEDVHAALAWARANAADHRIDPARLILFGYSMGGFAVTMAAANEPDLFALCYKAGFNLGGVVAQATDAASRATLAGFLDSQTPMLANATGQGLIDEAAAHGADWDLVKVADDVPEIPVLMITGLRDDVCPQAFHHDPLLIALAAAEISVSEIVIDADHSFLGRRIELAEQVIMWLQRVCM